MREEPPRRAAPVGRLGPGAASVVLLTSLNVFLFGLAALAVVVVAAFPGLVKT